MTKRPAAIRWFQRLYLLGIVLSVVEIVVTARKTDPTGDDEAILMTIGFGIFALAAVVIYLFWFFIMRRRSNVARWLLLAVTVLTAPLGLVDTEQQPMDAWRALEFFSLGLSFVTAACLFLPGARRWFDGTPDNLAETFS